MANNDVKTTISAKEMRNKYGVCQTTWGKYLEPLREIIPTYTKVYTPKQIKAIYDHLGYPEEIKE